MTIATPFLGSRIANLIPDNVAKELAPTSDIIVDQNRRNEVNDKIVSIYSYFDNHVWPTEHSYLEGAENIQVDVDGHHTLLWHPRVREIVIAKIDEIN